MRGPLGTGVLGAALLIVGRALDAEALLVPGVALVLLALVCASWVRLAARGATVERHLGARRVIEEDPLTVRIAVRSGRLPFPGGEIRESLLDEPAAVAGRFERLRIEARFARRGRRTLPPAKLIVRDPLGLAERSVNGGQCDEVLVLPRLWPVQAGDGDAAATAGAVSAVMPSDGADVEFDGLRPYRPGAPASRIHWPAVARGAGLLERHLLPEADGRPLVALDARGTFPEVRLDAAVRAAASLCVALARRRGCAILLPGERRPSAVEPDLRAWPAVHARLAMVCAGGAAPPATPRGRPQVIFYVTADPAIRPSPAMWGARGRARVVLVAPTDAASGVPGSPIFRVAGCAGYELGAPARRRAAAA